MSAICAGFVSNAWRKDICSNCFRNSDEHEINSVRSCANNNVRGGLGSHNELHQYNHNMSNASNGYSYNTTSANTPSGHNNVKNNHSTSHTMPYSHSVSISVKNSPTTAHTRNGRYQSPTLAQSGIPRIKTTSSALNSHSTKGLTNHDHLNNNSNNSVSKGTNNNSNNFGASSKLRGAASLEVISQNTTTTTTASSPKLHGHGTSNVISSRRHPSKADKDTMNNNSLLATSARSSSSSTLNMLGSGPTTTNSILAPGLVRSCGGSKENILHYSSPYNSTTSFSSNNNNSNCVSGSTSSVCPANGLSLTHPAHQFNCNTSTSNITKRVSPCAAAVAGSGYTTVNSQCATTPPSANASNSCAAATSSAIQSSSNCNIVGSSSNSHSSSLSSHNNVQPQNVHNHSHNLQNQHGLGKTSGVGLGAVVQMVHVNGSSSGGGSGSSSGNGVDIKNQPLHNNSSNKSAVTTRTVPSTIVDNNKTTIMDEIDGEASGGKSRLNKIHFGNNSTDGNSAISSADSRNTKSVIMASSANKAKGILKAKDGNGRRKLSVSFPKEVCEVIGYGGDMNGSSSDEEHSNDDDDEPAPDPQDSHSISQLLERNSTTYDEKELHTLTQKNTNFNSIKTNLLGITSIEIGPIVGCTGGKSMENASKPLVSIGTFESRKEPLKIRKQGDPEMPKVFNNTKSMINNSVISSPNGIAESRKFIQNKSSGVKAGQKVPPMKNETETMKKSVSYSDTTCVGTKSNVAISGGSSHSNYSKLTNGYNSSNNINNIKVNGRDLSTVTGSNAISTIQVNAEKCGTVTTKIATEKLQSKSNNESVIQSPTLVTNGGGHNANNHNQTISGHSQKPAIVLEKPKPKPILKNSQSQIKNSISPTVSTTNNNNNKSSASNNNSISNLIILTDGNIASKRTSFLRDIINDKEKSLKLPVNNTNSSIVQRTDEISIEGQNPLSLDKDSLESSQEPRIVKSELKVDLKGGNKKHTTTIATTFDDIQCANNDLEFDDSLEDSGLDINNRTEISESDEKSSSGSDSGNENDFSDRGEQRVNVKIIGTTNGNMSNNTAPVVQGGLFISVDDVSDSVKKPEKLSPDSVLFSSASEMSASGSSESIPDVCDKNSPVQAVNLIPIQKRLAPRPPSTLSEAIYSNELQESEEEVYDDVRCFYKNPADEEIEEESLYDDCVTLNAAAAAASSAKGVTTGSYNFTDGPRATLDTDVDGEEEKVLLHHNDGIEFIGIRKIDSETFLGQRSPSPKRERSSSASPKARRKVNQFFSTIGKKAGAAFSSGGHSSSRTKSPSALSNSSGSSTSTSVYKRSLSTDEVSMTRTQEIYATLTPTTLKFKGLAPVLQKLSRLDISGGDREKHKDKSGEDGDHGKEKMFKKNKISSSIKKFLRFGGKDGESSSGSNKYDFNNSSFMTKTDNSENLKNSAQFHSACMSTASDDSSSIPSYISEESSAAQSESSGSSALVNTPNASNSSHYDSSSSNLTTSIDNDSTSGRRSVTPLSPGTSSPLGRPPPPPPRVHSLDLLNKVGVPAGQQTTHGGTVRPARPPPPVRSNRVAPSFVSVFSNGTENVTNLMHSTVNTASNNNSNHMYSNGSSGNSSGSSFNSTDIMTPPNKPKRKASITGQGSNSRELENTYNHITSLNLETLRLIANQTPEKIKRKSGRLVKFSTCPIRWSQFHVSELSPMAQGIGFAFYTALWEDEPCVLLLEESMTGVTPNNPFQFDCLETSATFEDVVPVEFIAWEAEYVNSGSGVKCFISVLPPIAVESVSSYINNCTIPCQRKFFALLQAMNFWHQQEMSNLLVIQNNTNSSDCSLESSLIYVHAAPTHQQKASLHLRQRRPNSSDFEIAIKQLLLHNNQLLSENDRQVLLRKVSGSVEEVEAQLKLFLQLKLFSPQSASGDLEKIRKHRSERAIQQWLDRERAHCMNDAVQRSIQRESQPISPLKKLYLEFLMTPENSAKAILDMLVDLIV